MSLKIVDLARKSNKEETMSVRLKAGHKELLLKIAAECGSDVSPNSLVSVLIQNFVQVYEKKGIEGILALEVDAA